MRSTDDLFRLIRSLDKNEKRYFKLSVSKYESGGDSNYLRLFDAIDAQEEYDEEKLKKKFRGQKLGKNFPSEKNYLYRLILRTMRSFSQEQDAESRIKDLLREAEFLYRKALYDQCHKILVKAKEMAATYQKYLLLGEMIELEGRLIIIMEDKQVLSDFINKDLPLAREALYKASNIIDYEIAYMQSFRLVMEYGSDSRKPGVLKEIEQLISSPAFSDEEKAVSFEARHYFYHMMQVHYRSINNHFKMHEYCLKDVQLYESHPEIKNEKIYQYSTALGNLTLAELELFRHDDCLTTLQKLRSLPTKSKAIRLKINSVYYSRITAAFANSGRFEQINDIIDELSDFLARYQKQVRFAIISTINWNITNCYFGTGNYKEALKWLNKLLNDPSFEKIRPDLSCITRVFNLIIHYELENYDLLEHLIRSTTRYLGKKYFLFEFEKILLDFFSVIINCVSEKEKRKTFEQLEAGAREVYKKWENQEPDYIDIISWCRSKIEGRPFADIVKERVAQKQAAFALT